MIEAACGKWNLNGYPGRGENGELEPRMGVELFNAETWRGGAATKRGIPAEIPQLRDRGRQRGEFLDRMHRIDRMGGSAISDWMRGV